MSYKHGWIRTPEYMAWANMHQRCLNKNRKTYHRYGGRGIKVCDRWGDFKNFIHDMGPKPSRKHTLDRIDNNGNYEPSNCRWADMRQQSNNRENSTYISFNGLTKTKAQWSEILNIHYDTLRIRLKKGWSIEKALTTPVDKKAGCFKKGYNVHF